MGLDINTNIMATDASRNLATNEANMQNSLEQLSSGYRINKAADDASGLVISQHLQSQIGGFQQAQANTQSAINVVQTADGALNEVSNILQRIRTLAVQAANASVADSTADTAANAEVKQSLNAIDQISNSTVFGSNELLGGATGATSVAYTFQVGANSGDTVSFTIAALSSAQLSLSTISVASAASASAALSAIDTAISTVASTRGTLGAYQNELSHISSNESVMTENLQASNAQIQDTDMASTMVKFTQNQVLVQAGVSMLSQANSSTQSVLKLLGG